MKKTIARLFLAASAITVLQAPLALRADVLFEDATNYPYVNGLIEGQGQWYCYSPKTPGLNAFVTNNVLFLTADSSKDAVATPTNGWANSSDYTYASFTINVSQLPSTPDGGYFCQFQNSDDTNDCCHLFIDTHGTVVPGTYRLGIANYATSISSAVIPPNNYLMDLATNTTYTVVILFDSSGDQTDPLLGATLWVNPSEQDFQNAADGDNTGVGTGPGFAFGTDTTTSQALLGIQITQIGFSPYINAGISNVMAATTFTEANITNLPVVGIQPLPGTNYSGNGTAFFTAASGVDLTYQWYSLNSGMLHDDGINVIGSSSNILVLSNLVASDVFYLKVTDAYGNTATSSNAAETVITTPTPPYFPASVVVQNLTNNLFQYSGFTNIAYGTGPLYYQWYFAPTNIPVVFSPLAGQTSSGLSLDLLDFTYQGQYFVVVSNSVGGGSIAVGPTNSITELAPLQATMLQLHNYLLAVTNQYLANLGKTLIVNSNNVIASGYVVDYGGTTPATSTGSTNYSGYGTSYSEFFIQDASGLGVEVFLGGLGNTNAPPVGTYVTVTGELVVFDGTLEMEPTTQSAVATSSAPPLAITPHLFNYAFKDVTTNLTGANAVLYAPSLITLTNVYVYNNSSGAPLSSGQLFSSNGTTIVWCSIGQYSTSPPVNTNVWEIFQPTYNYGQRTAPISVYATNTCDSNTIPTYCYQLTGVYENFKGIPEIVPSRLQDYVTTPPSTYAASVVHTNIVSGHATLHQANVNWSAQPGSTYSVYASTNLPGGWTQLVYGLTYYPTNAAFVDTNAVGTAKFYRVSSP